MQTVWLRAEGRRVSNRSIKPEYSAVELKTATGLPCMAGLLPEKDCPDWPGQAQAGPLWVGAPQPAPV